MPVKAVVTGVILIVLTSMLVFMVEFFPPLSVKAEMDMLCRSALLRMENAGGLSFEECRELQAGLEEKGLRDVTVSAAAHSGYGGILTLRAEGDYVYNRLASLFGRKDMKVHMVYNKAAISRRVVN